MSVSKKQANIVTGILAAVVGLLFIIYKSGLIGIIITLFGALYLVLGIIDIVNGKTNQGIIGIIIGALIIILCWMLVIIQAYLCAAALIYIGVTRIIAKPKGVIEWVKIVILMLVAILLIIGGFAKFDWLFIVIGAVLMIEGIVSIVVSTTSKNYIDVK